MKEEWKCVLVRGGVLSVVMDGHKATLKLSAVILDMRWPQVIKLNINYYSVLKHSTDLDKEDYTPRPATNSKPIYMNNVHCSGQERTLLDCSYSRNLSLNEHHKDVGLQCRKCKLHIKV